jgi:drug/metabolite transporter (DMT)-like permease
LSWLRAAKQPANAILQCRKVLEPRQRCARPIRNRHLQPRRHSSRRIHGRRLIYNCSTSVANATFFATTAPIWVIAFGWLLFRERVGRETLLGLALCLAGGAALLAQSLQLRPEHALGDLFGLATGVFFGLYFLAVEAARRSTGAARVTFESSVVTAAALLAVALASEPRLLPSSLSGASALLGMAWVSHAGGQGLLTVALGLLPATFSSLVIFLEAVAAALFAFVLLGEPISLVQGLGGLLIMAGIYVARPRPA